MKWIFRLHSISDAGGTYTITKERLHRYIISSRNDDFTFDDGYADNYENGAVLLKNLGPRATIFLVVGRVGKTNNWDTSGELANLPLLDWDRIRELKAYGVRFGSHGMHHRILTELNGTELQREVEVSKAIIEERLQTEIGTFAYPYGIYDQRVIEAVKSAGYSSAMTIDDSILVGRGNQFRMRRIHLSGKDSRLVSWLKISGWYNLRAVIDLPRFTAEKITIRLKHATRQTS